MSCLSVSALCPWVSHDTVGRLLAGGLSWSGRLWSVFACRLVKAGGFLVLDDTAWQRWAQQAEAVGWVWCGRLGRVVLGMQVVVLIWTDGTWKVPIGVRVWRKGGPSKIRLAEELLREAAGRGVRPTYVIFDRWYAAADLLNVIEEVEWKYVCQIKSNRKLNGVSVRKQWRHRAGQRRRPIHACAASSESGQGRTAVLGHQ